MIVSVQAQDDNSISMTLSPRNGPKVMVHLTEAEAINVCDMLRDCLRSEPPYGVNLLVASQADRGAE